MPTNFTRRELAKHAGTGAFMMSASATGTIGLSTSATEATAQPAENNAAEPSATVGKGSVPDAASAAAMQRADELLRQMTIEEKAMQLSCAMPLALLDRDVLMRGQADMLIKQGIG